MKIFKKLASVAFLAIGLCVVGWSAPTPEKEGIIAQLLAAGAKE